MTGTASQLADAPPAANHVTDYDRSHVKTYLRLLDAAAEGADWQEVAALVLGLDVAADPDHTRRVHEAHLARARWMTTTGYRDFLVGKPGC